LNQVSRCCPVLFLERAATVTVTVALSAGAILLAGNYRTIISC
jgi:hypothetical protein